MKLASLPWPGLRIRRFQVHGKYACLKSSEVLFQLTGPLEHVIGSKIYSEIWVLHELTWNQILVEQWEHLQWGESTLIFLWNWGMGDNHFINCDSALQILYSSHIFTLGKRSGDNYYTNLKRYYSSWKSVAFHEFDPWPSLWPIYLYSKHGNISLQV